MMDVGQIIAYECGDLDTIATVELFAEGIKSGDVWKLQGSYGRTAAAMIDSGVVSKTGEIDTELFDKLMENSE